MYLYNETLFGVLSVDEQKVSTKSKNSSWKRYSEGPKR